MKLVNINRLSVIAASAALLAVVSAIGLYALPRSGSEPDASAFVVQDSFGDTGSEAQPRVSYESYGEGENHPVAQAAGWPLGEIKVTGSAIIAADADVGHVNMGVDVVASTVKEARAQAAKAMDSVMSAIKLEGITDDDISTTSFNIRPETVWVEERVELEGGATANKARPVVVGYNVANYIDVTVKNTAKIGDVIDAAAEAGGNSLNISNIYFSVSQVTALKEQLHRAAALDARWKAELYAKSMGVVLGQLISLEENYSSALPSRSKRTANVYLEAAYASTPTPISPGEESFNATVTASFAILGPDADDGS